MLKIQIEAFSIGRYLVVLLSLNDGIGVEEIGVTHNAAKNFNTESAFNIIFC